MSNEQLCNYYSKSRLLVLPPVVLWSSGLAYGLQTGSSLACARELVLNNIPQWLTAFGQIFPCRASEAQEGRRKDVGYHVDRDFDRLHERRERIRQERLEHLEDKAQEVVFLKEGGRI